MSKEAPKCKIQQKIYQTETLALINIHIIIATQNPYIQTERNSGNNIGCKPSFPILVTILFKLETRKRATLQPLYKAGK
jgi:hypothetical protein